MGGTTTAPAAPPKVPTPEQTRQAIEAGKLSAQEAVWDPVKGEYLMVPIAGDPRNNAVSAQTTAGANTVQQDLARRQGSSQTTFGLGTQALQGQFSTDRQVIKSPTQAVTEAAVAGATRGNTGFSLAPSGGAFQTGGAPTNRAVAKPISAAMAPISNAQTQVINPSEAEKAADQAKSALGPAPTLDMGIADRGNNTVQQALGLSGQVVDAALAPVDQTGLEQATADARNVLDRLLNGPNTADRLGAQTLRSQLALARSAAGGPGAVQEALRNAQMAAPELQAQAAQSATQEELAKTQAAGNVAQSLQSTALGQQQNVTQRIGAASDAASGFASGALGARGQDIQIAQSNQSAASNLLNNVAQLTGVQLELDQKNQEMLGQMARDAAAMDFNWAQLSAQQQDAEFARWVQVYGIDKAAAAQIAAAAKANDKSVWDYLVPLAGAAATIGAAALTGPVGGAAVGAAVAGASK